MKKSVKLLSLLLALLFVMAAFAGCGEKETEGDKPSEGNEGQEQNSGEKKDSIVIATANEPPTLAPYLHSAVASTYINLLTHDNFLRSDVETLEPVPGAIASWEILSDTQWKFTIRDDMVFHDGSKVTADDFIASMEDARAKPAYTSNYSEFLESIEKVDDYNFIVNTKTVYAKTLNDMSSHRILPKALIESCNDFNKNPIGSGPYKFVSQTLGENIVLQANHDYWGTDPQIENMTWRIIPEGSSRTIALEAKEIDFIIEVETNDLTRLQEDEGITVVNKPGTSFNWLIINMEKYPFDNQDFRHAINCAINKDALVEVALNGAGTGNYRQTPEMFPGHSDENMDEYSLDLAKEYIEKSGIDPTTVTFSCICSDDVKRRCAEVIQASLKELGITMNLESMDLATYLSAAAEGNFEATIGGATTANTLGFIEYKYTAKMIGSSNFARLNDPQIEELYSKASQTLDEEERMAILEQACARLNEICPAIPAYSVNVVRAYNSKLQGFEVNASGNSYWEKVYWGD